MPKKKPAVLDNRAVHASLPKIPAHYGLKPRAQYLPWEYAEARLAKSRNYWICTARPDGRPHSIPVWGSWTEGALYFGTAPTSRKALNLARNPALSVHLESGDDVVILEGTAVEVRDPAMFRKIDKAYRAKYQTPLHPDAVLYCVRPRVALAWTEKGFIKDATRWEFSG